MKRSFEFRFSCHSPESGPPAKASGRSRWAFASMATLPTPFTAYSKDPGLTELLRRYVCGLQPRPSVQLSSSMVIANDNEYSSERSLRPLVFLLFVRWLNFRFGLDQSYESLVVPFSQPESSYGVGQLSIHQPTVDCTL